MATEWDLVGRVVFSAELGSAIRKRLENGPGGRAVTEIDRGEG